MQLVYESAVRDVHGADGMLIMGDENIFAVFDGVGRQGGGEAAETAIRAIHRFYKSKGDVIYRPERAQRFAVEALWAADAAIRKRQKAERHLGTMSTTATLAHFIGGSYYWAHVGDSRLLHRTIAGDRVVQVTTDEGEENRLANSLGSRYGTKVNQSGSVIARPGTRVILCTDGITGDTQAQQLTQRELVAALHPSYNIHDAVINLFDISRKTYDDGSAIGIDVYRDQR